MKLTDRLGNDSMNTTTESNQNNAPAEPSEAGSVQRMDMRESNLVSTIDALMEIVEGCRGERWAANGMRLVDTKEWCAFYVASRRFKEGAHIPKLTRWRGRNQKLKGPLPMKNEKQTESQTASQGAAHGSRLVLQRRYLPASHMPKTWTEWHDHPEPQQIAWGPGSYVTLEENMKTACEGFYARGQGCEFRMVRRMNETLWEYSANGEHSNTPEPRA